MVYRLLRPALFQLDAERAHRLALAGLKWMPRHTAKAGGLLAIEVAGVDFPNPVGLAAGFDKDGEAPDAVLGLGFGFAEVGSVTPLPQPGNPRPRLFRLAEDQAVINRMGFNNGGAANAAERLRQRAGRPGIVGINLGANKDSPDRTADYVTLTRLMAPLASYLVVNVSSPNTPGLRELQDAAWLKPLLAALANENRARVTAGQARRPLLLKIAPDLSFPQIDAALQVIADLKLDGIIATNTTLARPGFFATVSESGGLSGKPLQRRATDVVAYIARATNGRLPIIGVGGIHDAASAAEKMDAGASLVQVYTGMIYRGPFFARELARALAPRQRR